MIFDELNKFTQIYSKLRPECNTGTRKCDEHLEDYSQWKKGSVLHINSQSDMQSKQTVALRLRLDSMAVSMLLSATLQYQKYLYLRSFYFRNFANSAERKGLSAFTGKFPSSTAGLHLVLKTSCLRKKSRLVRYRMVECFTIDAKRLLFRYEQYCTILPSRNKLFSRNPFEFLHIRESLVSRSSRLDPLDSRLETRSSNVSSIEARGSSLEVRVSSFNLLLSSTVANFLGSEYVLLN